MKLTIKDKIIQRFLQAQNEPISGQQLANELGVSRTAIWKHIQQLPEEGYVFETVKKKGYILTKVPDRLDFAQLKTLLQTENFGQQAHFYDEVESTQLIAHELVRSGAPGGTIIIADTQTAGRGRMLRPWDSAKGKGIWMTVIIRPDILPHQAPQFTLVTAVAVVHAMKAMFQHVKPEIKWPNDVLVNGLKTTGILTEMIAETDRVEALLVGIGMNVNHEKTDFPEELQSIATSLAIEEGKEVDRVQLTANVLHFLERYSDQYVKEGFGPIKALWEEASGTIGKRVRATTTREVIEGEALAITEQGVLQIRRADGEIVGVYSADIELV